MLDIKKIEAAVNMLSAEKKIPKQKLIDIIESAIKTAYKKEYGWKDENVNVHLNLEKWSLDISIEKMVVKEVTNPAIEISFEELWDDAESFEEWDMVELDMTEEVLKEDDGDAFWRIASQAARQVMVQKIWESEKEKIYELFKSKEWQIINMKIEMIESGKVILDYNWNQVVLPKSEQVARDRYQPDQRLYIYIAEVSNDEKTWPRVTLSRKHPNLVAEIFALYIPELKDETISIDKIVRQPWVKTKLLVSTNYNEIDPVGTLIWQKWIRVKSVMEELGWEKIDLIPNSDSIEEVIKLSLSPAEITRIEIDEENKKTNVYLPSSQRWKAVWKWWVNINLASALVGYSISLQEIDEIWGLDDDFNEE